MSEVTFGQEPLCHRLKRNGALAEWIMSTQETQWIRKKGEGIYKTAFTKNIQDKPNGTEEGRVWKAYQKENI